MKWLITVKRSADLKKLMEAIKAVGGEPESENPPIPLGDVELVLHANGPEDLPAALKHESEVIDVFPDSEMHPY